MSDAAPAIPLIVRPATRADAAAIAQVRIDTWRDAYRGILPDEFLRGLDLDKAAAFFESAIDRSGKENRILSGFAANHLCGFALWSGHVEEPTGVAELRALYVLPSHQGAGLGTALLERCHAEMRRAGFSAFVVFTLETNTPAREFYERKGGVPLPDQRLFEVAGTSLPEVGYRIALT